MDEPKPNHHYSGPKSKVFWNRIAGLRKADRDTLYACGCLLQNLEESVLHWLLTAEMDGKKVLRG